MMLDHYFKSMSAIPILSRDEELSLARKYVKGDKAAGDKIIEANLRFAVKVANKYRGYKLPIEDLIQQANLGLVTALGRFNPEQGVRFISYAVWYIRASLNRFVVSNISILKGFTTKEARNAFWSIRSKFNELESQGLTQSEIEESLAKIYLMDVDEVCRCLYLFNCAPSGYTDSANDTPTQETLLLKKEKVLRVRSILRKFARSKTERLIVEERLLGDASLADISRVCEFSRERARQIQMSFLGRIHEDLRDVA